MTTRDRLVLMLVCAVAAIVGGWLLVIQPKRDEASKLGTQIATDQSQLATLQAQVAAGVTARRSFATAYAELAKLGEAVPADDNMPSLIYQLQGAAGSTGVDFRSLVLNPQASAGTATATPSPTTGSAAKASATPTAASATQSAVLPPGAGVGPAGFPTEQFTFTFRGNFFHLANFFRALDNFVVATNKRVAVSGRLMTVNAINFNQAPQGFPAITASVSATTYLVPSTQGLFGGATPTGPGATTAVSDSSSSTATPAAVATSPLP